MGVKKLDEAFAGFGEDLNNMTAGKTSLKSSEKTQAFAEEKAKLPEPALKVILSPSSDPTPVWIRKRSRPKMEAALARLRTILDEHMTPEGVRIVVTKLPEALDCSFLTVRAAIKTLQDNGEYRFVADEGPRNGILVKKL
jgi:hypothetical protein